MVINAEHLKVRGDVFLDTENSNVEKNKSSECFRAEGEVKLVSAVIDGTLKCSGAVFSANKANPTNGVLNLPLNRYAIKSPLISSFAIEKDDRCHLKSITAISGPLRRMTDAT